MAKSKAEAPKPMTKSEILSGIAESTGLTKKDVGTVFDAMSEQITKAVAKRGPGVYTIPGLCKIVVVEKKAVPAKKNVKNPFTGEVRDVPAKPAKRVIRVRTLKALKDMI